MSNKYQGEIDAFINKVKESNPNEPEFIQAVHEVAEAVIAPVRSPCGGVVAVVLSAPLPV